jgi:hypothetical protein
MGEWGIVPPFFTTAIDGVECWTYEGGQNGQFKILHNKQFQELYRLPNIVRALKFRRMVWAGHNSDGRKKTFIQKSGRKPYSE